MRNKEILDSWKDISDYLDRDIRTCARWEKELGLPVYRFDKEFPRSKVSAYKSEIDEWLKEKKIHKEIRKKTVPGKKGGEASLMADFRTGEIYYFMGDLDNNEAVFLQFEDVNDVDFNIGSLFYLGMIAAQQDDTSEVERILKKIKAISPKEFDYFEDKIKIASIYMGIGKEELGYDYLQAFFRKEKTDETRYISLKYVEIDKNFDHYINEERFKNIIQ